MPYYRLNDALEARGETLPKGTLLFTWLASAPPHKADCVPVTIQPDGWGGMIYAPRAVLDGPNPMPQWQEFEQLLRFYMRGADLPPNLTVGTAETLDADLNSLVGGYGAATFSGRLKIPGDEQRYGEQAIALVDRTQGGLLTGSAVVLRYLSSWGPKDAVRPRTARFKLCDHAKVTGHGANPQRGWHPGRCSKCSLDMTVDSGD